MRPGGQRRTRAFVCVVGMLAALFVVACAASPEARKTSVVATARSMSLPPNFATPPATAARPTTTTAETTAAVPSTTAGQVAAAGPTQAEAQAPAALTATTAAQATAHLGATGRIGVQVFEADVVEGVPRRLAAAGVHWARTRALWKLIEGQPGRYDWTTTDAVFASVAGAGLHNIVAVYANPSWAAPTECGPVAAGSLQRFRSLWSALVERYDADGVDDAPGSPRVDWWQVGNEADFEALPGGEGDYGSCFGDAPEAYAQLLALAISSARKADPTARVSFGPVAYDRFTASSGPPDWTAADGPYRGDFVPRAFEALAHVAPGVRPDGVSLHNYNDNANFWDRRDGDTIHREIVGKIDAFRADVVPQSARDLPVLISETGMPSSPSDVATERSPSLQAAYAAQTLVRSLAAGAEVAVWYTAADNLWGRCEAPFSDWSTFGLFTSHGFADALSGCPEAHPGAYTPGEARPALAAVSTVAELLRGTDPSGILGLTDTGDPAIEAYRFAAPRRVVVAAWTTTGRRLGARRIDTATRTLPPARIIGGAALVRVVDAQGEAVPLEGGQVPLGPAPVFAEGATAGVGAGGGLFRGKSP